MIISHYILYMPISRAQKLPVVFASVGAPERHSLEENCTLTKHLLASTPRLSRGVEAIQADQVRAPQSRLNNSPNARHCEEVVAGQNPRAFSVAAYSIRFELRRPTSAAPPNAAMTLMLNVDSFDFARRRVCDHSSEFSALPRTF